jgi:hypothetical protein
MTQEKLQELVVAVEAVLNLNGVGNEVSLEFPVFGGIQRLVLTRKFDEHSRYLRITPVTSTDTPWEFEVLGGTFGSKTQSDNFDSRRGGSSAYILDIVRFWLIDQLEWGQLPRANFLGSECTFRTLNF